MKNLIVFIIINFLAFSSHAANINFDVDGYVGLWGISPGPLYFGNQTIDLPAGVYNLVLPLGGSVEFTVNSDGTVTSSNLNTLMHSGSTLTFKNKSVYFDVGPYNYFYSIGFSNFKFGSDTYRIPVGLSATIDILDQTLATFYVNSEGNIYLNSGFDSFDSYGNTIVFKTVKVSFDTQMYIGPYSLYMRPYIHLPADYYLLPKATYTLATFGGILGKFTTNLVGVDSYSNSFMKAEENTVTFYQNKYTVTPPVSYTDNWHVFGHGTYHGPKDIWMISGMGVSINAGGANYPFSTSFDCTSFVVSTAVGDFSFVCNNQSAFYSDTIDSEKFNSLLNGFVLQRYDGRFSSSIVDYTFEVNGINKSLSNAVLTKDKLYIPKPLSQGRNAITLNGKYDDSNTFQFSEVYWVGTAELKVKTIGISDTVTLNIQQTINGVTYSKSFVQQADNYETIFKNVSQITDGSISISSGGRQSVFREKLPNKLTINL